MTTLEFERAFRAFARRRPFLSFLIELASGDRFLISHPEAVRITSGGLCIYTSPSDRHRVFAGADVCQLLDPPEPPET